MSRNKWVCRYRTGAIDPIDEPASVGADLSEFVDPAQGNLGSLALARNPYFAIVQPLASTPQEVFASRSVILARVGA